MKAVILAGGLGTGLSEETDTRPKPMVEVGGHPILRHILKIYSQFGINDFIICCGSMGYLIKEYFANYFLPMSNVTFDMGLDRMEAHQSVAELWRVTLVDTGENADTGGRLKKVASYLEGEDLFCMTYGDSVSNVDIAESVAFHRKHGKFDAVTAVQPPARFGGPDIDGTSVREFQEKPQGKGGWMRSSFFSVERLKQLRVGIATARAGNVIGSNDWSGDRLIPDLVKGFRSGEQVRIRRPKSIRPWQHVLKSIFGYISLVERLPADEGQCASAFNFGPDEGDTWSMERIASHLAATWGKGSAIRNWELMRPAFSGWIPAELMPNSIGIQS
jgi:glucose-1-phosphate cytidylyltransferase